ncbi:peptidyl-tRNA hydrolase PTH2-domain-containing protein [Biscogniauxia marginata]|nr:peptidyl-tRNA hydrolase PTH2-domain-containing protein [Biscogniauxia marginata]
MADPSTSPAATLILTTSVVAFLSGFLLGVYSIRGYVVPPAWAAERARNLRDPVESDESDVDEDDTVLDHAPNWANGEDADRRQGLRVRRDDNDTNSINNKKNKNKSKNKNKKEEEKEKEENAAESSTSPQDGQLSAGANPNEECKLVLVVRTDLGMTKGKIAAQCSHATLACYKSLSRRSSSPSDAISTSILRRWERLGQAKIAVQTKSEAELLALMSRARALGVTAEVIQDAGRTQIDPGSLTVLGVGPAPRSLVDQVTGGLKLL